MQRYFSMDHVMKSVELQIAILNHHIINFSFFRSEMFCLLLFCSHFLSLSCFLPMTPAPRTDLGDMFKEELCMIFLIWS